MFSISLKTLYPILKKMDRKHFFDSFYSLDMILFIFYVKFASVSFSSSCSLMHSNQIYLLSSNWNYSWLDQQ